MEKLFPFCYPLPTAFYLSAYLITLLIHFIFMNYVLAGTAYLAISSLIRRSVDENSPRHLITETLRDWLPFATGAAITAGVAPLLFLQILYKPNFYTANLLLLHRWMAILPALILGFYMLYLLKTDYVRRSGTGRLQSVVALTALACFGFTAWSWTENHLLSLDWKSWPDFFGSRSLIYSPRASLSRVAVWLAAAFPTMATLLAWQLKSKLSSHPSKQLTRHLAAISSSFIILMAIGLAGWIAAFDSPREGRIDAQSIYFYGGLLLLGIILQLLGWTIQSRRKSIYIFLLLASSAGLLATLSGILCLRELHRAACVNINQLFPQHAEAFQKGGLPIFLTFLVLNAILIALCIHLARSPSLHHKKDH